MSYDYSIIVIGAGAAGLVVAIGSARAGKKVLLIEKGKFGGDCTNYGCVPSKSLIASSHTAHSLHQYSTMGLEAAIDHFQAKDSLKRTREIVRSIREKEEPEALAKEGVDTLCGKAVFIDSHTIEVQFSGGRKSEVTADNIVIACGSAPINPKIEGIEDAPTLTNETIFDLKEIPEQLAVIGGGPIGCELAQAFRRLGSEVCIIQNRPFILEREEKKTQTLIQEIFQSEGIQLHSEYRAVKMQPKGDRYELECQHEQTHETIHVPFQKALIAIGRTSNVEGLNVEQAGIKTQKGSIVVDRQGRTSVKHIWAAGDAIGPPFFTHWAEAQARQVLFNLLSPWPFKQRRANSPLIPRVTYTDPEIAAIGLTEQQAKDQYGEHKIAVYHLPLKEVDRAICTGETKGFIQVITKKWSSKILGASIVSPRAGEMLMEIAVAMEHNIPLRKLSSIIHPYPIYNQGIRKVADQWLTKTLLPTIQGLFSW